METKDKNMISKNEAAVEEDNKETPIKEGDQKKDNNITESIIQDKTTEKRKKKIMLFSLVVGISLCLLLGIYILMSIPQKKYNLAIESMNAGNYQLASEQFAELGDYEDAATLRIQCNTILFQNLLISADVKGAEGLYQEFVNEEMMREALQDTAREVVSEKQRDGKLEEAEAIIEAFWKEEDKAIWKPICIELARKGQEVQMYDLAIKMYEYYETDTDIREDLQQCRYQIVVKDGDIDALYALAVNNYADAREKLSEVLPSDELFEQLEFGTVDINLVEKNDGYYVPMSDVYYKYLVSVALTNKSKVPITGTFRIILKDSWGSSYTVNLKIDETLQPEKAGYYSGYVTFYNKDYGWSEPIIKNKEIKIAYEK
jgi:hypothetical protein